MTWWQTLIVAVVPALVAAGALLTQHELAGRREANRQTQIDAREDAAVRRAERLDAHTAALAAIGELEHTANFASSRTLSEIKHGTYEAPEVVSVSKTQIAEFEAALATVTLMCSAQASVSLRAYYRAVQQLVSESAEDTPTFEAIDAARAEVTAAKLVYLRHAKAELGLSF